MEQKIWRNKARKIEDREGIQLTAKKYGVQLVKGNRRIGAVVWKKIGIWKWKVYLIRICLDRRENEKRLKN